MRHKRKRREGKIASDQQYHVTQEEAERFAQALAQLPETPPDDKKIAPSLWQAHKEALQSRLEALKRQLHEYEADRRAKSQR